MRSGAHVKCARWERRRGEMVEILHLVRVPGVHRVILETSQDHVIQRLEENLGEG